MEENTSQVAERPAPQGDCISPGLFVVILVWIIVVSFGRVAVNLGASISPSEDVKIVGIISGLVQAFLLGLPLALLALLWKNERYRAVFQTWALASLFILALLPAQFTSVLADQAQAILHILLSALFTALVAGLAIWRSRRAGRLPSGEVIPPQRGRTRIGVLAAVLFAAFLALPWLAAGAFGSLLDILLQTLAALAFGVAFGVLLEYFLLAPLRRNPTTFLADFFLGSFAIGGTLTMLATAPAFPFGAMQLLLLVVLPSLGGALMGLSLLGTPARFNWLPLAVLIGLAAAAPMTLVDPDELPLVVSLGAGEILQVAASAASNSLLIALVIGILLLVLLGARRGEQATPARWVMPAIAILAVVAWLVAGMVYYNIGQVGFHGERLFVIMESQADLSEAVEIEEYTSRREYVYDTLTTHADSTQADLRQALDRFNIQYTSYYLVNALEVEANPFLRIWLESRADVDRVLDSPRLRPLPEIPPISTGATSNPPALPHWNLTMINADRVWNELGVTGEGIVVGQSDSGVQGDHPELAASYRGQDGQSDYHWLDPWNGSPEPVDIGGHGTHTLGSILGQNTGVAPGASWFACVNLARNLANPPLYLDCMQFMLAPFPQGGDPLHDGDPALGAHVINNSWGCPDIEGCDPQALVDAVRALRAAGVFVVVSAGNDGPGCATLDTPPALYDDVFSVGAVGRAGDLASFSSIGPVTADGSGRVKPDILAPGVEVLSAMPGSTYMTNSGTSMAGPHVVGVVALIWSANPALIGDIERTEEIIIQTAQPYQGTLPACPGADAFPSTAAGYGIVDAFAAVQMAIEEGR